MLKVYVLALNTAPRLTLRLRELLDTEERRKAERFATDHLARRYIVAHGALRLVLGSHLGVDASEITFDVVGRNKPVVAESPGTSTVEFNLSHSGDTACIAISRAGPVGVDVEELRDVTDSDDLLSSILSSEEIKEIAPYIPMIHKTNLLLRCWTLKESVVKAAGHGLYVAPAEVVIAAGQLRNLLLGRIRGAVVNCPDAPSPDACGDSSATPWLARPLEIAGAFGAVAVSVAAAHVPVDVRRLSEDDLLTLANDRSTTC